MADSTLRGLSSRATLALTDEFYAVDSAAGTPADWRATLTALQTLLGGQVRQVVNVQNGTIATGTTTLPIDNTIPQNTEGTEFMTLAITPKSATSKLKIEVVVFASNSAATQWMTAALFQDSTANALAAGTTFIETATAGTTIGFTHYMTAGTTSATTFKVRIGAQNAGTTTFNGGAGGSAQLFGGVMASSITITEIRV